MSNKLVVSTIVIAVLVVAAVVLGKGTKSTIPTSPAKNNNTQNTNPPKSNTPLSFDDPMVVKAQYATEDKATIIYDLYGQIEEISGSKFTLKSEKSSVQLSVGQDTNIKNTSISKVTPGTMADLKQELWVSMTAFYVVNEQRWGVTDIFINTEWQGPVSN